MPWKNGGGETTEVTVFPASASLDDFDWRVSMARVASDGPFSMFDGIDRTLCVLEGNGIDLEIAGDHAAALTAGSAPFSFPADTSTNGRLVDGPISDLNVMTRRGRFVHRIRVFGRTANEPVDCDADTILVLAHDGGCELRGRSVQADLQSLDCAVLAGGCLDFRLACKDAARAFVIEIVKVTRPSTPDVGRGRLARP